MREIRNAYCLLVFLAAVAAISFGGCGSSDAEISPYGSLTQAATAESPDVYPFVMGATNLRVGEIRIWNDADNLYVEYVMDAGYTLGEAHVCVSTAAFPWTPPGQCPYQQDPMQAGTAAWTFTVPLADLGLTAPACDALLYLQVHSAVVNTATGEKVGSAYAGTFKGRISYVITCEPPPSVGCTYTQGYWKTHPSAWPVPGLTIGGVWYTRSQLINLLKTAPRGDASLILGDQLIASMLDVASGASTNAEVSQALADAQSWMAANKDADGLLPYGIRPTADGIPNPEAWDQAINLGAVLDLFNNGLDGPPHCQ